MSVFDYNDYRAYLRDWFQLQKSKSSFSYSTFANLAGFSSRSYLRLIITNKRNISDEAQSKFVFALGLNEQEAKGFRYLVKANQAPNIDERLKNWRLFLEFRPSNKNTQLLRNCYDYLSNFLTPLLKVLVSQKEASQWSIPQLADYFQVEQETISDSLKILLELGMVRETEEGAREVTENLVATMNDVPNVAIQSFHRNSLTKAIAALELPPEEREFQSLILGLSVNGLEHLRKRLREVASEIDQLYVYSKSKRLIKLNRTAIVSKGFSLRSVVWHEAAHGLELS